MLIVRMWRKVGIYGINSSILGICGVRGSFGTRCEGPPWPVTGMYGVRRSVIALQKMRLAAMVVPPRREIHLLCLRVATSSRMEAFVANMHAGRALDKRE